MLLVYGVNVPEHPSNTLVVNVGWLTILTLCTTILLLVTGPVHEMVFFYNCLRIDSFSLFLQVIILLSVISVILLSLDYLVREGIHSFEYMVLILLSSCSMLLMVASYDLIGIYLTIEFQSLAFYVIAASKQDSEKISIIKERKKPNWLPPQPFLNIGIYSRLFYERNKARSEI